MSLIDRLRKAEAAVAARPDPNGGWVTVLTCHPTETDPDGRPPGFYPADHPRSTVADVVFAGGQPDIPHKLLAAGCLVIVCDPRPAPGPPPEPTPDG